MLASDPRQYPALDAGKIADQQPRPRWRADRSPGQIANDLDWRTELPERFELAGHGNAPCSRSSIMTAANLA